MPAPDDKRPNEPHAVVTHWLNEITSAKKREKDFRKEGQRVLDIYEGKKDSPFNILYSNTETLLPALYSAVPRPVVQRRFKDEDPLGKYAADAGRRVLEYLIDTNIEGYETFDEGIRSATLDALLPGRGVTTVKYDADVTEVDGMPVKTSELVCVDTKSWNRVYFGYAKKWSKVPWIAYEEYIDKEEAERLFGEEVTARIVFTDQEKDEKDDDNYEDLGDRKVACIYQIWDKTKKKVCYISAQYIDGYLKEEDDPLGLTGFFNTPKPLTFLEKSNDLLPVALYCLYENQAKELNRITQRINKIVEAVKARGIYDTELGADLSTLMDADDNALVPADKSSSLAAEKGLQNAIWFMPLDQLVGVLEKLYAAREQCKRVIYEVTGISDIIRGSTAASETATAQKIKSDWGTLRLKRLQKEVQRYARDVLRMMLEVASTKFSEETFAKLTGLPFVSTQQAQQLQMIAQAAQMSGQPLDPKTQEMLKAPVWGQVLETLKNDQQRSYRIDIETNSTVEPEAVEDQKNISELMTALGQYLNGVGPLVAQGVMPFEAAQSMMLAIARRFRFGPEIEDEIKAMKAPPPDNGEKQKAAEQAMQAQQQQMQKDQQSAQKGMQDAARITQLEQEVSTFEKRMEQMKKDIELSDREKQLEIDKALFDLEKQAAKDQLSNTEKVGQIKTEAAKKEISMSQSAAAKEKQNSQKADSKLGEGVSMMKATVQQLAKMQADLLQVVSQQATENQQNVAELVKAVTAPRKKTAVRGKDGRIAETIEEVVLQ